MRSLAVSLAVLALSACGREPLVSGPVDSALIQVEGIGMALASDDLAGAKKESERLFTFLKSHAGTPQQLAASAASLQESDTLDAARDAFSKLSRHAVELAKDRPAFHIIHCPQAPQAFASWVQMGDGIANPYLGGKDVLCGVREK